MADGARIDALDVLGISAGKQTNVVVKCTVVDRSGRSNTGEVVFAIRKDTGLYSIEKVVDSEAERLNKDFDDARRTLVALIASINSHQMESVKPLLSFTGVPDFDVELSARGLSWIKDSIDKSIMIKQDGMAVYRSGIKTITGRVYVPEGPGSTNCLKTVVFKDGKVDCCMPLCDAEDSGRRNIIGCKKDLDVKHVNGVCK